MTVDAQINYMRKRVVLTDHMIRGNIGGIGALTAGVTELELGTSGMVGNDMADGEFMAGGIVLPYDLDPKWDIGFRVHWTVDHDGAGACTVDWILLANIRLVGAAIAVAATALDTPIATVDTYKDSSGDATVVTDWLKQVTARGIMFATNHKLSREQIEDGAELMLKLEQNAMVNATKAFFRGLEIDYVPMMTIGQGSEMDRPLKSIDV